MAPHSSTLAWKLPRTEEPGGVQSMGSLRVGRDWSDFTFTFHFPALEEEMATLSSVLAWRIPGTGEPGGLPSLGLHRARHDWSNLATVAAAASAYDSFTSSLPSCCGYDFNTMLSRRGESGHPCLDPELNRNVFSFSQLCIILTGFVIHSFYYVKICSLYTRFVQSFYHEWVLNFVKYFLCIY